MADCPDFIDVFVEGETLNGLQPTAEVVGIDKVINLPLELLRPVIVVAVDGSVLDGAVYSLNLSVIWHDAFGASMSLLIGFGLVYGETIRDMRVRRDLGPRIIATRIIGQFSLDS